jgi:hypothetical protein
MADVRKIVSGAGPASQPAVAEVEVPSGRMLRKGRYRTKFQGMDAGYEDFVILSTARSYYVQAYSRPSGGPQPPSDVTLETDKEHTFIRATWRTLTAEPLEATYTREGDKLRAEAKQGETQHPPQELTLPAEWVFGPPMTATEWAANKQVKLAVGESKTYQWIGFGMPSWQLMVTEMSVERLPDESIPDAGGKEQSASVYASKFTTPMGNFSGKSWLDGDGLTIKSTLTMPFGSIEVTLEGAERP